MNEKLYLGSVLLVGGWCGWKIVFLVLAFNLVRNHFTKAHVVHCRDFFKKTESLILGNIYSVFKNYAKNTFHLNSEIFFRNQIRIGEIWKRFAELYVTFNAIFNYCNTSGKNIFIYCYFSNYNLVHISSIICLFSHTMFNLIFSRFDFTPNI